MLQYPVNCLAIYVHKLLSKLFYQCETDCRFVPCRGHYRSPKKTPGTTIVHFLHPCIFRHTPTSIYYEVGATFLAFFKNLITERNSHLVGETKESSITNSCCAKAEQPNEPQKMPMGRRKNNKSNSVIRFCLALLEATLLPWRLFIIKVVHQMCNN